MLLHLAPCSCILSAAAGRRLALGLDPSRVSGPLPPDLVRFGFVALGVGSLGAGGLVGRLGLGRGLVRRRLGRGSDRCPLLLLWLMSLPLVAAACLRRGLDKADNRWARRQRPDRRGKSHAGSGAPATSRGRFQGGGEGAGRERRRVRVQLRSLPQESVRNSQRQPAWLALRRILYLLLVARRCI